MRPQQARSVRTRARILAAALELLGERGYTHTSLNAVCERAGVTRGALLYHFANKTTLVVDAIEFGLASGFGEPFEQPSGEPATPSPDTVAAAVDRLWSDPCRDALAVGLDLVVAACADERLRPVAAGLTVRIRERVDDLFTPLLLRDAGDPRIARVAAMTTLAVINGLLVDRALGIDDDRGELTRAAMPAMLGALGGAKRRRSGNAAR